MRAFIQDDDDETAGEKGEKSGDISMFCKACLHPYCGEQKSGTIVLRCERCGQTDTVLEESVGNLKPEEWIGNLMMNRFITVVKEQEDLSANLSDTYFAEDDYKGISLFLSEYTFNIEKIAVHLYDIAKKAKMASEEDKVRIEACQKEDASMMGVEEVQAMNATKALLEIHKTLIMNDPIQQFVGKVSENAEQDTENVTEKKTGISGNELINGQTNKEQESENCVDEETDNSLNSLSNEMQNITDNQANHLEKSNEDEEMEEKRQIVRDKLNHVGASICALIENLSVKYNISDDVMITVQAKLLNIGTTDTTDTNEHAENDHEAGGDDVAEENSKEKESECSEKEVRCEKEQEDTVGTSEENNAKDDASDSGNENEESRTIFNVPTETIRQEVHDALGHKLKLIFENKQCATRKINWDKTDDSILDCPSNEVTTDGTDKPISESSQDIGNCQNENLDASPNNTGEEEVADRVESDKEISDTEGRKDRIEVNFYSLACEFIRELQRRKNKALGERKNKTLANIRDKIDRLKQEMERVEVAVTEELALAYKRKMKKVEKQKKQLDEKHSQVKEAERLLEYYAMTGQEDKVAELIEQFNIQYEN